MRGQRPGKILHALTFLIERQPQPMHLCVVTREDPPLGLPRLRGRGQITETRAHNLRFTGDETALFLNRVLGIMLTPR
jgi:LuxR family maltose regulon positive regulatory protein